MSNLEQSLKDPALADARRRLFSEEDGPTLEETQKHLDHMVRTIGRSGTADEARCNFKRVVPYRGGTLTFQHTEGAGTNSARVTFSEGPVVTFVLYENRDYGKYLHTLRPGKWIDFAEEVREEAVEERIREAQREAEGAERELRERFAPFNL